MAIKPKKAAKLKDSEKQPTEVLGVIQKVLETLKAFAELAKLLL